MFTPTDVYERSNNTTTQVYFADNISSAHQKLIDRFNWKNLGKIEVIPVNLPFTKISTNERKELPVRTLRNKNNRIDLFAVDLIWVPHFTKWCLSLDNHFNQKKRDIIIKSALESCYHENQLFAISLYNVVPIYVSPLIKPRADISLFIDYFLKLFTSDMNRQAPAINGYTMNGHKLNIC